MSRLGIMKNVASVVNFIKNNHKTYHHVLDKVKIVSVEDGNCTAKVTLEERHLNQFGTMHGGFSATLVDCFTSSALMTKITSPHATVDLHVSFLAAAKSGDTVLINATVIKKGNRLAFIRAEITNELTGELVVSGTQTALLI